MRFTVEVRVLYRGREMAGDTALALAAVQTYVARLSDAVIEWHADAVSGLKTVGSHRWGTIQSKANEIAREAATKGWLDPAEAQIEITIMPGDKPQVRGKDDCEAFFLSLRPNR